MDFITAYIQAFARCYPQKQVSVKPKRVKSGIMYRVVIDSDAGERLLSEEDMRSAIRMFNRGH